MLNRVWKKKLVISCLAFVLLIQSGGCGQKTGGNAGEVKDNAADTYMEENADAGTAGGYREFDLPLPDGAENILALREAGGAVWMITAQAVYSSPDQGETWECADAETAAIPAECPAAAVSREGAMAFASKDGSILIRTGDGTQNRIENIFAEGSICYTLDFVDEGMLLASDTDSNICIVDLADGTVTGTIPAEGEYHYLAAPVDGAIVTLTGEGARYYGYQGEMLDGNEVVSHLLSQDIADFNSHKKGILAPDSEGSGFFYACRRGLYHYASGGSITEQLIEGTSNSMGDDACEFYRMAALSGRTFLLAYRKDRDGSAEMILKKYAAAGNGSDAEDSGNHSDGGNHSDSGNHSDGGNYSDGGNRSDGGNDSGGGTAAMQGELTVYTLNRNVLLEEEINAVNRSHPGCVVSVETGLSEEAGLTADDAVKTLNTEILAGTGPDLLILDGMAAEQYCESGLLLDLRDVLREAAETDGVYEKIAYTYEDDGAVCAVPARFCFPVMAGGEDTISRIADLDSLADEVRSLKEQHPEQTSITGLYDEGLLEYLFDFCAPAWVDGSGQIDTDRLKDFLEIAKEINDLQKAGVSEADIEAVTGSYLYSDDNAELIQPMLVTGGSQSLAFYHSKSLNFSKTLLGLLQDGAYSFDGARGQCADVFIPKEIVAVNAKSRNQESALAFVKEFLSSSCQETFKIEDTAYPVNRAAFRAMEEAELKTAESSGLSEEACREGFERISDIIEHLSVRSVTDTVIRDAVTEQGMRFLNGELTLEDAVSGIEQKAGLHMAE